MQNENLQIFKIPITGHRKKLTQQTIHDNEKLNIRMLENKNRLQIIDKKMINKKGKKMTMYELFDLAQTISNITKRKIDRLARRNRNGLLCWLAESIDIISNKKTLEEIKARLQENNNNQNQQEQNEEQNNDTTDNDNQNFDASVDNEPQKDDNNLSENQPQIEKDDRNLLQRQLFPDIPQQIVLPPLINHKSSKNSPQDLSSIYNLLNHD